MAAALPEPVPKNDYIDSDKTQDGQPRDPEKAEAAQDVTDEESGVPTPPPARELERWNETGVNVFRFFSTIYCFILMGMMDGAIGVCLLPTSTNS
jgi:hypothetical protein